MRRCLLTEARRHSFSPFPRLPWIPASQPSPPVEEGDDPLMSFACGQKEIRPDAPWPEFLDVRYRLLTAYQRYERRQRTAAEVATADQGLRIAFLRLSGALDQVTVPLEVRVSGWTLRTVPTAIDTTPNTVLVRTPAREARRGAEPCLDGCKSESAHACVRVSR